MVWAAEQGGVGRRGRMEERGGEGQARESKRDKSLRCALTMD